MISIDTILTSTTQMQILKITNVNHINANSKIKNITHLGFESETWDLIWITLRQ